MAAKARKKLDSTALVAAEKTAHKRARWNRANKKRRAKRKELKTLGNKAAAGSLFGQITANEFPAGKPIEALAKLGLTNNEIAEVLGIGTKTFTKWVSRSPGVKASLLKGRRLADTHVANSLYNQAIGFTLPEEKLFYNSKTDTVVKAQTKRHIPPSVVAGVFWLKNRHKGVWAEHRDNDPSVAQPSKVQEIKFTIVNAPGSKVKEDKAVDAEYSVVEPKVVAKPVEPTRPSAKSGE